MNNDEDLNLARMEAYLDDIDHRNSMPFNGVMGVMPEWVPEPFKSEFRRIRDFLLNNHSEDRIIKWTEEYKTMVCDHSEISSPVITYEIEIQHQIERLFIFSHAVELGETEGLRLLASGYAVMGRRTSITASKNAGKPRPKKNYEQVTFDSIIATLKRNHPEEKPSEVWIHFKTAIEEWSDGDCKESGQKDSRRYDYKIQDKRCSVSYGTFRKKLNK